MSSEYDGNDPKRRLNDIAEGLSLIRSFIDGISREEFLADKMRQYAVVRALEEICEAAYWFTKHENGAKIRADYPDVKFARFGSAGNIFRHQYGAVRYDIVWDDIIGGPDIAAMEDLLASEVPFYSRHFSGNESAGGD